MQNAKKFKYYKIIIGLFKITATSAWFPLQPPFTPGKWISDVDLTLLLYCPITNLLIDRATMRDIREGTDVDVAKFG